MRCRDNGKDSELRVLEFGLLGFGVLGRSVLGRGFSPKRRDCVCSELLKHHLHHHNYPVHDSAPGVRRLFWHELPQALRRVFAAVSIQISTLCFVVLFASGEFQKSFVAVAVALIAAVGGGGQAQDE